MTYAFQILNSLHSIQWGKDYLGVPNMGVNFRRQVPELLVGNT